VGEDLYEKTEIEEEERSLKEEREDQETITMIQEDSENNLLLDVQKTKLFFMIPHPFKLHTEIIITLHSFPNLFKTQSLQT